MGPKKSGLFEDLDPADEGQGLLLALDGGEDAEDGEHEAGKAADAGDDAPDHGDEADEGEHQARQPYDHGLIDVELGLIHIAEDDGDDEADPGDVGDDVCGFFVHGRHSF